MSVQASRHRLFLWFALIAFICLDATFYQQNQSLKAELHRFRKQTRLQIGAKVPTLRGLGGDGEIIEVTYEASGPKTLLLVFSPYCGWSEKMVGTWKALSELLNEEEYRVVLLATIPEGSRGFIRKHGLRDLTFIREPHWEVYRTYRLRDTPQIILIDAIGQVEAVWTGALLEESQLDLQQTLKVSLPLQSNTSNQELGRR